MQALSVTTGLCAITVDSDTGTADASSTSRTPIAPNLSQPPYDRWTDLPDDVTVQVMYWLMLDAGTVPLALASGRFLQAGQVFRASPWYEGAKSVLMHQRCLDWTRSYLSGFANEPQLIFPKEVDELNTGLASLGKWPDDQRRSIVIDSEPITSVRGMDWLDGFRRYPGASLALTTGRRRQAEAAIIDIARALPPRVCLRLQCYPCTGGVTTPVDGIASLVSRIAQTGRAMAFDMEAGVDLSANAAELEAVLDIACGEGVISFINLGTITQPDIPLRSLPSPETGDVQLRHAARPERTGGVGGRTGQQTAGRSFPVDSRHRQHGHVDRFRLRRPGVFRQRSSRIRALRPVFRVPASRAPRPSVGTKNHSFNRTGPRRCLGAARGAGSGRVVVRQRCDHRIQRRRRAAGSLRRRTAGQAGTALIRKCSAERASDRTGRSAAAAETRPLTGRAGSP